MRPLLPPAQPPARGRRLPDLAAIALVILTIAAAVIAVVIAVGTVHSASANDPALPQAYAQRIVANGTAPVAAPAPAAAAAPHGAAAAVPARMGGWTAQIGVDIANRALHWLGWPYSFAGGDANGPTYGVAVDSDSRNDSHIRGFDCSGLVLYALAPYRRLEHFAATQYLEAGRFHPALNELEPGDLVFWSKDGTVGGVGHVAIYIGKGNVVQAPRSGERIVITPLYEVEPGAIGTTRPLT
jgi:cell wall-associated NlpC family hydrolase